jgi:hypothetical protein
MKRMFCVNLDDREGGDTKDVREKLNKERWRAQTDAHDTSKY